MIAEKKSFLFSKNAQTAVEYLLLFGVVVAIVLIGMKAYLPRVRNASDQYFNKASKGIMGRPNKCGDGSCIPPENFCNCPIDCTGYDPGNVVCNN